MKHRQLTIHEDAGEDMHVFAARPPEFIIKGRVSCGICSVSHEPLNKHDEFPQCPFCGNLIDLQAFRPNPYVEHGAPVTPAA